jgi:hypothetical protein
MQARHLWFGLVLLLAACGGEAPSYQSTSYAPPATPGGRMCIDQCEKSRDFCRDSCTLDYRACYVDVQKEAQQGYDTYAREHFANHQPIDLFPSDFEHPEACNKDKKHCLSDCEQPYNSCYTGCGGTISVTKSCQFLCFE